jgi:hypothetical protein
MWCKFRSNLPLNTGLLPGSPRVTVRRIVQGGGHVKALARAKSWSRTGFYL